MTRSTSSSLPGAAARVYKAVGSGSPDDELTAFFSPHATGKDYLFVAVFGIKRKPSDRENAKALQFLDDNRV